MIRYRANCPGCGRECWWHGYPVQQQQGGQSAVVFVKCPDCEKADRARNAQRVNEMLARTARPLWVD